jgi:hypothetical protein
MLIYRRVYFHLVHDFPSAPRLCHHSRGVHHWAPRKVLALGLANATLGPTKKGVKQGDEPPKIIAISME